MPETDEPQGTVCILQGRAEFIEKYFEVIGELLQRGFAVVAFDWRGQGLPGRPERNPRKRHVQRLQGLRQDLEAVRRQETCPHLSRPHFSPPPSLGGGI